MEKRSGELLNLVLDRMQQYGPNALAAGAGLASLSHLMAIHKRHKEEKEKAKGTSGVIYIDVPKVAGEQKEARGSMFDTPSNYQYLLDSGLGAGVTIGAGALGYTIVDSILKKVRKRKLQEDLDRTKQDYAKFLSQKIYRSEGKMASEESYPMLEGLIAFGAKTAIENFEDQKEEVQKNAELTKEAISDPTLMSTVTSLPGLGALLAGILAHNYWYNKQKDIELAISKAEAEKTRRAPSMIKLRTMEDGEQDEGQKMGGVLDSGAMDTISSLHTINTLLDGKNKPGVQEEPKEDIAPREPFSEKDVIPVDDNTVMVLTDGGDVQLDALDPEAIRALEKYKDIIARSLAMGLNTNRAPANE
jgi:hypothetical protein